MSPITRVLVGTNLMVLIGSFTQLINLGNLILDWDLTIKHFHIWRPVTAFFVQGSRPLQQLFAIYNRKCLFLSWTVTEFGMNADQFIKTAPS
uniref:ARAD1C34254p n=1 Tax=Blastobotrys adeninivorans TaxID=409370 RepID=A0A060T918_BLAAD